MTASAIEKTYELARQRYAEFGVDTDRALKTLAAGAISMHCWQGDDVAGFENAGDLSDSGLMTTGNYGGRARTPDELRADMAKAFSLIPGTHRANVHALYAETGGKKIDRNALTAGHFAGWIDWCRDLGIGMDFNPSFFAHPMADSGFTLASRDKSVRRFWIDHGIACRRIGGHIGQALGSPCVTNHWIPDGYKDIPADRKAPRELLERSLDEMFAEPVDQNLDAVESKLFGIGSESYVVGSHEFYLGYAVRHNTLLCLDTGHFHPTESIADKISAVLVFVDRLLLHVSRGVRWDSDHVTIFSDEVGDIARELVRGDYLGRVHIALDYFDASINRVAAWVIGMRATLKALLAALLEPVDKLREFEINGDFTSRLALMEDVKLLPLGAVWDYHCLTCDVPAGNDWMADVRQYEADVQSKR